MNRSLALDLVIYSALLLAAGLNSARFLPERGAASMIIAFAAAVLCLVWGVLGLRGFRRRAGPVITLAVLAAVLLPLTVKEWIDVRSENSEGKSIAILGTILFVFALVQALNIFQRRPGMFAEKDEAMRDEDKP